MPGLNGLDVCRRIRAAPWGRAMRVIAQTGWGQGEDRQRTRGAGFDHHVVKPIDVEALDALIRSPTRALSHRSELDPRRRVIAGVVAAAHLAVDAGARPAAAARLGLSSR